MTDIAHGGSAPRSTTLYRRAIIEATPRLLGQLDRESLSPTWGSFDRDHWAWKFRDFPVNMLQFGLLPLSWLHQRPFDGNPYAGSAALLDWLIGGTEAVLARQHRNGAFDTVAPNSQDHGVTLAMVYALATLLERLGEQFPSRLRERTMEGVRRGCAFAARSSEDYAFISNHQALFALAWLRAGELLGDDALVARAEATVSEIIRQQSADGWYREYGGPDPGYESLGLLYLAQYRSRRPSTPLDRSLEAALEFHAHCIHPDGSVGGGYGSRHTSLWYPGGFELLARDFPQARATARFLRERLDAANVVTPATVDAHNLASLLNGYSVAADACAAAPEQDPQEQAPPLLPCERAETWRAFDESGIVVAGKPHYYAVTNMSKGGVLVVHDRGTRSVAYEDGGYVVIAGGHLWSSALLGNGRGEVDPDRAAAVSTLSRFGRADREILTPIKFLLLRLLNLTVFRSVLLGSLVRRMIIARLVTGRMEGPFRLTRHIEFGEDRVEVRDEVIAEDRDAVTRVWRPRSFTAIHMGSARYFSGRDLVDPDARGVVESGESARLARRLAETGRISMRLVISCAASQASAVQQADDTAD